MDNKPSLPEPPATEEPSLQQTPDILNQQPQQPPKQVDPPIVEPEQQGQQHNPEPAKKRVWIVVLLVVAAVVLTSIVSGLIYWATVLSPIDEALDEQNEISQMLDEYRIETVDELVLAHEEQSALDCSYSVTLEDEIFDVNEQADYGRWMHKVVAIGSDSAATALAIKGDAVYSWGYSSDGEEYATKTPWSEISGAQEAGELSKEFDLAQTILDAKDTIGGIVCMATNTDADFTIPEKDWVITSY